MEKRYVNIKLKGDAFISPFLMTKFLEQNIGRIEEAKSGKDGILLKITSKDFEKIKNAKINNIEIEVTYNDRLNTSKGVIFHPQLKYIDDTTILEELAPQGVIQITRFLKNGAPSGVVQEKGTVEGKINTGLFMLTFNKPIKPFAINICYEKIEVKTYYPNPLRCNNCFDYGHKSSTCRKTKICGKCPKPSHGECDILECPSCGGSHPAWDRKCPTFIKEKEIIQYAINNAIPFKQARLRFQTNVRIQTYAETTKISQELDDLKEINKTLQDTVRQMQIVINQQQAYINQMQNQQPLLPQNTTPITETKLLNKPPSQPAQQHLNEFRKRMEVEDDSPFQMETDPEPPNPATPNQSKRHKPGKSNEPKVTNNRNPQ